MITDFLQLMNTCYFIFIHTKYRLIIPTLLFTFRNRPDSVKQIMNDLLNHSEGEKGDLAIELTNQVQENKTGPKQSWWHQKVSASPFDWNPDPRESDPLKGFILLSLLLDSLKSIYFEYYCILSYIA